MREEVAWRSTPNADLERVREIKAGRSRRSSWAECDAARCKIVRSIFVEGKNMYRNSNVYADDMIVAEQ